MSARSSLRQIRTADLRELGRKAVSDLGYTIRGTTSHAVVFQSGDGVHTVAVPRTSSDVRNYVHTKQEFERWARVKSQPNGRNPFVRDTEVDLRIIELLVRENREMTTVELASALGLTGDVDKRLKRLADEHRIVSTGVRTVKGVRGPGSRFYAPLGMTKAPDTVVEAIEPPSPPTAPSKASPVRGLKRTIRETYWNNPGTSEDLSDLLGSRWSRDSVSSALSALWREGHIQKVGHKHGYALYVHPAPEPVNSSPVDQILMQVQACPPVESILEAPKYDEPLPFDDDPEPSVKLPNFMGYPPSFWEDIFQGLAYAFARVQR